MFLCLLLLNFFLCRPELKPVTKESEVVLKLPDTEPLSPPILQLNEILFRYNADRIIFKNVNLGATMDSRICIVNIICHIRSNILSSGFISRLETMELVKPPY